MLILGIETSTLSGSIAINNGDKLLIEINQNNNLSHSIWLLESLKKILEETNVDIKDLEAISVSVGPGAFTSLRVGVSTAKSLAYCLNIPLVTISSLEVLALNISFAKIPICPLIDAKRGEIYAAIFKYNNLRLERIKDDFITIIEELSYIIKEPTIFLGTGAIIYKERLINILKNKAIFPLEVLNLPRASLVATLGEQKLKKGDIADLFKVEPIYLRKAL
jgi:tRNA threonylcarbamoyladenosine biosynthesis protein TsaB